LGDHLLDGGDSGRIFSVAHSERNLHLVGEKSVLKDEQVHVGSVSRHQHDMVALLDQRFNNLNRWLVDPESFKCVANGFL
jgi:hypothetical protein